MNILMLRRFTICISVMFTFIAGVLCDQHVGPSNGMLQPQLIQAIPSDGLAGCFWSLKVTWSQDMPTNVSRMSWSKRTPSNPRIVMLGRTCGGTQLPWQELCLLEPGILATPWCAGK